MQSDVSKPMMKAPMTSKQKRSNRTRWVVLVGIAISALFLYLAFQGLQPQQFLNTLGTVSIPLLLLGAAVYFIAVAIISLRWQFLLQAVKPVPLWPLMQIVAIGYMGNNVYPLRAGEALRIYLLRRNHDVNAASSATTVVVERAFDGIVMLTFIIVSLLFLEIESDEISLVLNAAAPIFALAVIAFFVLAAFPNLLSGLVQRVARILPQAIGEILLKVSEGVIGGLAGLRSPLQLAGAVLSSYTTWAVEALVYWIVMQAFGLELGYPVALLVVGTVNLAGLIPASPGQVGVYEFFASAVLVAVGVDREIALAYAIVVHIVIWLPITLAGFFFLIQQGMGWRDITHANEMEEAIA